MCGSKTYYCRRTKRSAGIETCTFFLHYRNDEYLANQGLEVKDVVDNLDFIV